MAKLKGGITRDRLVSRTNSLNRNYRFLFHTITYCRKNDVSFQVYFYLFFHKEINIGD